eukprot:g15620.t2
MTRPRVRSGAVASRRPPGYDEEGALRKAMDESRREAEQREASKKGQGDDSPRQEVGSLSSHGSGHTATPCGLSNPGHLCYFNALVQAVSSPSSTLGCTLLELAKLPAERRNALPATFKMADIARKVNSPLPAPTTPLSIEDAVRELLGQTFDSARQHCVYDAFGALVKRINQESTSAGLQPSPFWRASPSNAKQRRLGFALTGTQFGGSNYGVRGIIVHEGERATSGHYKALVKAGGGAGGWFCADDRTVTEVTERYVIAQEDSMFVLQREGTNAERASSAAVGAFLLGMAPIGAAMQGVDAGGVAAGDARASGSAGVNTDSDSDRSDGGGVVNDGNGSIGGGSVDSSGGGGDNTDGDSDGMDGDSSGKRRKSCGGGRKKEHGGGCREDSSGNSSTGGATSKASSGGSSNSSNGTEKCGTAAAAALPKRRRVDGGSAGGAAKRKKSGGGSGNTTGEEPMSGDDDDDSSGSGSKSRSRSSSSSGGGGSSGGGSAFSPAQAAAMESLKRDAAWFLRIEDREVSPAERQKARRLLENPRELHGLRNEALARPRVYRGTRSAEDLDRHQLRDLVGAALLPENGLSKILGFFHGDLRALERACIEAELQGPVEFSKFLRDRGVDAPVNPNHPAFAGDPTTWTHPILFQQAMCLQYQKRAFYHEAPPTTTGKSSAAASKVSSFEETVRELASVGGRKAFVYWGRHQSKTIGDPAALESAARGDLELYRECTNGEAVIDAHVGGMMVDILMEAIEIHAEANGGEPTDNDIRRSDELEEARDQGLSHILEVTGRIGQELRGKHVRTKADCSAGGKHIRKAVSKVRWR